MVSENEQELISTKQLVDEVKAEIENEDYDQRIEQIAEVK